MDPIILIVIFLVALILVLIITNQEWYVLLGTGALIGALINSLLKSKQKSQPASKPARSKISDIQRPQSSPIRKPQVDENVDEDIKSMLKAKMQQNYKKYSKGTMAAILDRYNNDRRSIDEKMAAKCAEQATLDQRAIISNSKQTDASQRYIWEDELTAHENRVWWEQDDNFDLRM